MSVSQEQLSEIHRQLKEVFLAHPIISIKPAAGEPPEQYEISYNIEGFSKSGRNDVALTTGHQIEITIPFGFPHFPPSCKPKSDIFHPDFDPAAICLGDFWQQHSQIPDLIFFLGKLINGESYSTTNAFNEEAAIWYQSHENSFPIADIKWQDSGKDEDVSPPNTPTQIDTIDDADISPEFNLLSIEGSSPDPAIPAINLVVPAEEESPETDLGFLHQLKHQKYFFGIRQALEKLSSLSDEIEKISAYAEREIKRAEEIYHDAQKVENSGNLKNAARLYEEVETIAADFPNLDVDKKRVLQSLTLLDKDNQDTVLDFAAFDSSNQLENKLTEADPEDKRPKRSKRQISPSKPHSPSLAQRSASSKIVLTLGMMLFFVILAAGGGYYFIATQQLDASLANLDQCKASIKGANFEQAKESCEFALQKLSRIKYILQNKVDAHQKAVTEILASEELAQGLAGNALVDGKYYAKKDADTLLAYKLLLKEGNKFFEQENWVEAEDRFVKIVNMVERSNLFSKEIAGESRSKLNFIRFSKVFSAANTLLSQQKWPEAASEIKKAKSLLESLPREDRQKYAVELSSALAKCNFEEFRKQGDDFFSKADWLNAISTYKSVLPTGEDAKLAPKETLDTLRENISRAELYATIDKGNKAFISGSWDEAIQEYNKAGSILTANQETINLAEAQQTRKKIDRIILQTTIIRDRQAAAMQQEEKKDLVAARNIYRQIVTHINNSSFSTEREFLETKRSSIASIQTLDESIYKAEKEQYLKDNFRTLFVANYPTAIPENLKNPTISYIKETDGKMIFKMQCLETDRGRPLALVMFYAYDKTSNSWNFFSEK